MTDPRPGDMGQIPEPERLCYVDCGKSAPECACRSAYPFAAFPEPEPRAPEGNAFAILLIVLIFMAGVLVGWAL